MTKKKKVLLIISCTIVLALVLMLTFFMNFSLIYGTSMEPTYKTGAIVWYEKIVLDNIERYDVIVLKHNKEKCIKRVIGLGGETIEIKNNIIYIDDVALDENDVKGVSFDLEKTQIAIGSYFVIGDNRESSIDSRDYGSIEQSAIKGKIFKSTKDS